jgi:hypothetical protein
LWLLDMHTAGLLGAYPLAPCLPQGSEWHVGVLVIRGHATRADFHASILTLLFDASNLLFLQGCKSATNFSSFVVDQALA